MENNNSPQRESVSDALKKYKANNVPDGSQPINPVTNVSIPKSTQFNQQDFEKTMAKETDPDLMTSYEVVQLPSKGMFYSHGISEVNVEYMTSKDEDLLTTPSLIENGTVLDILLRRKIKTSGINVNELLAGDRNAIILFLRTSSYGSDYTVQVADPRNGIPFNATVNLLNLRYKELVEFPDEFGCFTVEIPMRKKTVRFKLLNSGEDNLLSKKADAIKEAYNEEYSQYSTMKLKLSIVSINEKSDRSYIDKFVDAMPALDAFTIRKKILEVSPDVDMSYEFTTKDEYKFKTNLTVGVDFFFPQI